MQGQRKHHTIKFLNFWTPENFALINLKFKQRGQNHKKDANGIANSEDSDQTAPRMIWVCTVCSDLYVPKLKTIMVMHVYQ